MTITYFVMILIVVVLIQSAGTLEAHASNGLIDTLNRTIAADQGRKIENCISTILGSRLGGLRPGSFN
jgi:hypothetical protein